MNQVIKHYPVMLQNVIANIQSLQYNKTIKIADCNFGFGGHSKAILDHFPNAIIQAYDLDKNVLSYYQQHYQPLLSQNQKGRLHITNQNFATIRDSKRFESFDVILADFGFNSYHLQSERGFSWLKDEELDMRYSQEFRSCKEIINQYSELQLIATLRHFGQIKEAKAVAKAILQRRPITTTKQLRQAITLCFQQDKTRKIAQVFQAFRIATNNQLSDITLLCGSLQECLSKNGLFLAITFHSLERNVVQKVIKEKSKLFSKIQTQSPSSEQLKQNSKSNSAKMLSCRKR